MTPYKTPPLVCIHGRQTANCAACAPVAEAAYRAWRDAQKPAPQTDTMSQ